MSETIFGPDSPWRFGLALMLGMPLLMLVLGELSLGLHRRQHPMAGPLRFALRWILPVLALDLFLTGVLGWPASELWVRVVRTVLWILVAVGVLNAVNSVVFEAAAPGTWPTRVPELLRDLLRVLLVALAGAIVFSNVWGKDLSGALTALGVSSIVVGLALQQPLGNLFSGVMLLMERPFEVGDEIEVGSVSGVVTEINWRSAHIKTRGGVVRIVPNSTLNHEILTNYSVPDRTRREFIEASFSYEDPPNEVCAALLELAAETPGVLPDPKPSAMLWAYADSGITYRMTYLSAEADRMTVRNALMARLWYATRRHGLSFPYPVRVNLNHPAQRPFGKPQSTPAQLLARFPNLPALSIRDAERDLRAIPFGVGEAVFEQGDILEGLHVLVSGKVLLRVGQGALALALGEVGPGEFFGEAGMYGPQAAPLTAVALEDVQVVLIAPEAVRHLFDASASLARDSAQLFDARRKALQAARQAPAAGLPS